MKRINSRITAFALALVMVFGNTSYVHGADGNDKSAETTATGEISHKNETAGGTSGTKQSEKQEETEKTEAKKTQETEPAKTGESGTAAETKTVAETKTAAETETAAETKTSTETQTTETETETETASEKTWKASETVDGVKVTVTADAGVFPEKVSLSVSKVTDKKDKRQIENAVEGERSNMMLYK